VSREPAVYCRLVITTHRLSKLYGRGLYALRDLTITVGKGEFVFLTGPSGAGKSTLLRLLLAQDRPTEGEVIVSGRNLARLRIPPSRAKPACLSCALGSFWASF